MEGKHQILFTFYGNAGETINILHKESLIWGQEGGRNVEKYWLEDLAAD